MTAVWDEEDAEQERALIQLEHPDWSEGEIERELKKRKLQPSPTSVDPDTLTESPDMEEAIHTKRRIERCEQKRRPSR